MHPFGSPEEQEMLRRLGEPEYMRLKLLDTFRWIRENPRAFAGLTVRRFAFFWWPHPGMWHARTTDLFRSFATGLTSVLCLGGLVLLFRARHRLRWLIAAALSLPGLAYYVTHVDLRYRYATWCVMVLLAAVVLDHMRLVLLSAPRSEGGRSTSHVLGLADGSYLANASGPESV